MNEQIRRLGIGLLIAFVALFVQLNFIQVFGAERLDDDPLNTRSIVRDFGQERGQIVTADGVVVAESLEIDDQLKRERRYPEGALYGHITGFFAFDFGASGVERRYNDELAGQTNEQRFDGLLDVFGSGDTSADLHLTIDSRLQETARDALGTRRGSVVAVDPQTGAVLALWSYPSFDPNLVSTTNLEAARNNKALLDADPQNPLLARSYREIFFPGSTFKVVTAAAGLESEVISASEPVFPLVTDYTPPLTELAIGNFAGGSCGGDLGAILRDSCNTSFAQMGAEILGPEPLVAMAEAFGFNDTPPFDLPAGAASVFPTDYGAALDESDFDPPAVIVENTPALAQAAIGQFDVRATPLEMALVAAGVANGGEIQAPHVMGRIVAPDGSVVAEARPDLWRRPVQEETADTLRELMVGVVEDGSASGLQISGIEVGAKTGTAQTVTGAGPDDTHAWIIGFAGSPGEQPEIAFAVLVEAVPGGGQQTGGQTAAPIAKAVLETWVGLPEDG